MKSITASINVETATKLLITNELDMSNSIKREDAYIVLEYLAEEEVDNLLRYIDYYVLVNEIPVETVPQFGLRENLIKTNRIISDIGVCGINCPQLGFRLKEDVSASVGANTKFGENHGKAIVLLGMANYSNYKFYITPLGEAFEQLEESDKNKVMTYLYFKIPLIQCLLREARTGVINAYDYMTGMTDSTKYRRAQCIKKILKEISGLNNNDLQARIKNINWIMESGEYGTTEV